MREHPVTRPGTEENLKILDSTVHPLDANSNPYNFPKESTLLHKAARALNLPVRSPHSYVSSTASASSTSSDVPKLDERYTGQILVSAYHVSYILPKEFPRRETDPRSKRPSTFAQFMAAIDIWAPYISQPPHAPYLVSPFALQLYFSALDLSSAIHTRPTLPVKSH